MTAYPSEQRLAELRDEARYRRERLQLYKARIYAGRAYRQERLSELERASAEAAERLARAEARAAAASRRDG